MFAWTGGRLPAAGSAGTPNSKGIRYLDAPPSDLLCCYRGGMGDFVPAQTRCARPREDNPL